ncbi:MAG: hypothetical protein D6805_02590 [Planctomycetota bacterium]|nr:MAG: hypothetical protein D6805_02590 [Planctomycetota bacterium]
MKNFLLNSYLLASLILLFFLGIPLLCIFLPHPYSIYFFQIYSLICLFSYLLMPQKTQNKTQNEEPPKT